MKIETPSEPGTLMTTEVVFNAEEGGYIATVPVHGIVTQADSVGELNEQVRDAVSCHSDAAHKPALIRWS